MISMIEQRIHDILYTGKYSPQFYVRPFVLVVWMNFKDLANLNVSFFFSLNTIMFGRMGQRWGKTICMERGQKKHKGQK